MFTSRFSYFVRQNQGAWRAGLAVVVAGTVFKVGYFNFSRGIMVDHMDRRHLEATEHLKSARETGLKMAREREDSAPQLTPAQRKQLQEYLQLMQETQLTGVYPGEEKR